MKEIEIDGSLFRVYESGEIERKMKAGSWKFIPNTVNHSQGYNVICINKKQYMRSRIIYLAYMPQESTDKKILMHHLDGDRLNCSVENLSVENHLTINVYR
jgi:hypothetical protein